MEAADRWSTPRLAEFVAAITGAADEQSATRRALDWATEALEAEIGLVVEDGSALVAVGFPRGAVPTGALRTAVLGGVDTIDVDGIGMCCLASTRLELESAVDLVVARAGMSPFTREEVGLLRAAARALTLTLRLFRALSAERTMSGRLQQRQALLERLSIIQRSITRRAPLGDVLNTITSAARDLLDVEIAAVRLVDSDSPGDMLMVAQDGLPPAVAARMRRTTVGSGAGGGAVASGQVVLIENYRNSPEALPQLAGIGLERAMAAPVRDGDVVIGSITVATTRADIRFGPLEQEVLSSFAEHASLAITDAKRVDHIQKLAFHDELTGLPNRGLFRERLEQALIQARRRGGDVAVLFLDLDRFKTINDSLGHAAGDQLLVAVAERLRGCLRDEDTASRLGGDEFAILAHCDGAGAAEVAERILRSMEPSFMIDSREVSATASIGIALDAGGLAKAETMLRDADIAMYRAKFGRGGGYVVFEPSMHAAAVARIDLEEALSGAWLRGEMHLDYQPIVDLTDLRVAGIEALVRWRHPHSGLMSPVEFIPLAEETGRIAALGRWILDDACAQVRLWQDAIRPALRVGQRVAPATARQPLRARRGDVTGAVGAAPGQPRSRDHRRRCHGRCRDSDRAPAGSALPRRIAGGGRLWYRPLVARPVTPPSRRHHQG